jgi:hypothetical protein
LPFALQLLGFLPMKTALFVDFDNVYSGLRQLDPACADRFARRPGDWMNWLTESLPLPEGASIGAKRRVLVRRCYLNPQAYQRFRPSFNLAGFEIVDCPALTSEGKTSTDIHMVLDIVDLLQHEAHYDEFIVFSADADFTPVLRKLRRWDRRTTVLAIGFPSGAYRASADLLIDQDDFVRNALGFDDEPEAPSRAEPAGRSPADAVDAAFALIQQTVGESAAPVPLARIASTILAKIPGIDAATWGGFGSFRGLLDSRSLSPLEATWEGGGTVRDPRRHALPAEPQKAANGVDASTSATAVADLIRSEVAKARQPVACGALANLIINRYPSLAADWNGKGSFRRFAESLEASPVIFDWSSSGGSAIDPAQAGHTPTETAKGSPFKGARSIHEATGIPLLTNDEYRQLFGFVAADVAQTQFHLMETGKRVRDRCREAGLPVSRADVNYVLRGLVFRGHAFDEGPNDANTLGEKLAENVRALCLREQMVLDPATDAALAGWLTGRGV